MLWEALGATLLGFVIAGLAVRRLPERLPNRPLAFATGPAAALLGGLVSRVVMGSGHTTAILAVAALVSVAILSLLLGGEGGRHPIRPKMAAPPRP